MKKKAMCICMTLLLVLTPVLPVALADEAQVSYMEQNPASKIYDSVWTTKDANWRAEVYGEDDGIRVLVVHRLGDNKEDVWELAGFYDGQTNTISCMPTGLHYRHDTVAVNDPWEMFYEDGSAVFALNKDGMMTWQDEKEDAGKGLEFIRIGNFYGTKWVKDDIYFEFYDWYDGEYDIRMYKYDEKAETADNAILRGAYDAETGSVTAVGCFDDGESFSVTFTYNDKNDLVWTQDGVSTVCEYDTETNG